MIKYAQNYNQAIDYLRCHYPEFDGIFRENEHGYFYSYTFKLCSCECACGESQAIRVYDEEDNLIEQIIICDSCYETEINTI